MTFLPPDPARVAEWVSVFETLEAVGRLPTSSPETKRRRAVEAIRSENRLRHLRVEAEAIRSLSDDERDRLQREIDDDLIAPQCPGVPIRVSSLDR